MISLSIDDKKSLLILARSAICAELFDDALIVRPSKPSEALSQIRGCFVTLHRGKELRGCIGTIEAAKPLVACVEENAVNSAFNDPRFPGLKVDEIDRVDIEISALSAPERLEVSGPGELKKKLRPGEHGVILSRGFRKATFLPQVWEHLPKVEDFLSQLCLKAGMGSKCWKEPGIEIRTYDVEHFSETELLKTP
jgi:AmmeMemoRadiSam system protein A